MWVSCNSISWLARLSASSKLSQSAHGSLIAVQDEHILARKYADKWMVRALGVGLFKRKLHRREVEDTRQLLLTTINPLTRVSAVPCVKWCCGCCVLTVVAD